MRNLSDHRVECDICSSSSPADWTKCADCRSFDLCKACYSTLSMENSLARQQHEGHQFVSIALDGKVVLVPDICNLEDGS